MGIVFLDSGTLGSNAPIERLHGLGDVTLYQSTLHEDVLERIRNARIIITNKVPITAEHIARSPVLELIVVTASVADIVDKNAADQRGVLVRTIGGYSTDSVAQLTFCVILHLLSRYEYYSEYVASGEYSHQPYFAHVGPGFAELRGKQLGVIGLGRIGTRVAEIGAAFGAEIVYFSTTGKNFSQRFERVTLPKLLQTSDVVTIHAPRTQQTTKLIGHREFREMKQSAILVNTGRGGVVDEAALTLALTNEWIAGAALDVFEIEPLPADSSLLGLARAGKVVLTPHCAWGSDAAQTRLVTRVEQIISNFLRHADNGTERNSS
jgi:lactate dehydrogenase-like 2-hydroxyacid dehydrogenase